MWKFFLLRDGDSHEFRNIITPKLQWCSHLLDFLENGQDSCAENVIWCSLHAPSWYRQGCRSLLNIEGDNLQFYPKFALFSTLRVMNLDHDFVQVSKLNEDQEKNRSSPKWNTFSPEFWWRPKKKGSSPKMEHFFSPNSGQNQQKKRS